MYFRINWNKLYSRNDIKNGNLGVYFTTLQTRDANGTTGNTANTLNKM